MYNFSIVLNALKNNLIAYRQKWEKFGDILKFLYIENSVIKLHISNDESVYWSANQEDILAEDWVITDSLE